MTDDNDKITDLKIQAAESRTDTKIVRLEGKLDLMLARVEAIGADARRGADEVHRYRNSVWAAAGAVMVILGLLFTVGQWMFGTGMQLREAVRSEVQLQDEQTTEQPPSEAGKQRR